VYLESLPSKASGEKQPVPIFIWNVSLLYRRFFDRVGVFGTAEQLDHLSTRRYLSRQCHWVCIAGWKKYSDGHIKLFNQLPTADQLSFSLRVKRLSGGPNSGMALDTERLAFTLRLTNAEVIHEQN
jgi:hypothetical protein